MKTLRAALMELNRFHIVELLRDGPLTVGQIAERLGLQQPRVSKHLKVLSEAAIVEIHKKLPEGEKQMTENCIRLQFI